MQFLIGEGLISRAHRDLEICLEIGDAVANFMGVGVSRALPIHDPNPRFDTAGLELNTEV